MGVKMSESWNRKSEVGEPDRQTYNQRREDDGEMGTFGKWTCGGATSLDGPLSPNL